MANEPWLDYQTPSASPSGPSDGPWTEYQAVPAKQEAEYPYPVKQPIKPRSVGDRVEDSAKLAALEGSVNLIMRYGRDWLDSNKDLIRSNYPNASPEELETLTDNYNNMQEKIARDAIRSRMEQDPAWKPDGSFFGNVGRIALDVVGGIGGSGGPEMFIPGAVGKTAVGRIGTAAGIGAATDTALQGADIGRGVEEEFDTSRVAGSAIGSAGLQGVGEGVAAGVKALTRNRLAPEVEGQLDALWESGTPEQIMQFADQHKLGLDPEAVSSFIAERDAGRPVSTKTVYGKQLEQEAQAFQDRPQPEPTDLEREAAEFQGTRDPTPEDLFPVDKTPEQEAHVNFVVDEVNKIAKDWKNSPEFEVVNTLDDIEDEIVRASVKGEDGVIGFVGEDGKVRIVASEVRTPEDIAAVTFHEALGHRGLQQKYQEGLDGLLETLYDSSGGTFKKQVDDWIARNPDEYADDVNPLARAAEEVLAEMSESGQISPTVLQRIRNYLKQFGRDMGLDLKYSDDEIRTILGLSHKAITDGEGVPVGSALRFKTRQQQINEAREQLSAVKKAGDFKTLRPFEDSEPDYWRFRYRDKNGELLSGNYTINEQTGNIENFSIYGTTGGLGPKGLRDLVKRFKENHPEATSLEGYRMTGARKASGKVGGETPGEHLSVPLNRFMKRRAGSGSEGPLQGGSKKEGSSLGLGRFRSKENLEQILSEGTPEFTRESWEDWIDAANSIRMKAKSTKNLRIGSEPAEILAAREAIVKSGNRIAQLSRKAAEGELSERDQYILFAEMARNADMQDALAGVRSNAGRIVNSFKIEVGTDKSFQDSIRKMVRGVDNNLLSDPENAKAFFKKVADVADDPEATNRLVRDAFEPKAEDYVLSTWYNVGLLSRPSTQFNNLVGTLENIVTELPRYGLASIWDLPRGLINPKAERIVMDEVFARAIGMAAGVVDGVSNMKAAYMAGRPITLGRKEHEQVAPVSQGFKDLAESLPEGSAKRAGARIGQGAGFVSETAGRLMSSTDELFRSMAAMSELYGTSIRKAYKEQGGGPGLWSEAARLRKEAPPEELADAADYARRMVYRDEPSPIAKKFMQFLTRNASTTPTGRVGKVAARIVVPFVNTPDSIIRTVIRDIPVVGMMDRYNKADWASGPMGKSLVKGRMTLGLGLGLYAASLAMDDKLTGEGPSDPAKRMALEATGWKPNAIRNEDGSYTSVDNLGPSSTYMRGVASLVERYKSGELDDQSYLERSVDGLLGFIKAVADNTWTEGLFTWMGALEEGGLTTGSKNVLAGAGASFVTPGIVQATNQAFIDPARRVTTGDGSLEDRFTGRVASAYPGYSEDLPQRHDVYGRPMSRPGGWLQFLIGDRISDTPTDDPVFQELSRLEQGNPGRVVGPPGKRVKIGEEMKTLDAEDYQRYQELSGRWIIEDMQEEVNSLEWQEMSDEEKLAIIKEVAEEARKDAREELFPQPEEEEETTTPWGEFE